MTEIQPIKKDWESARQQYIALYINATVNIETFKHMIAFCDKKIEEFPKTEEENEDKAMAEELKKDFVG